MRRRGGPAILSAKFDTLKAIYSIELCARTRFYAADLALFEIRGSFSVGGT